MLVQFDAANPEPVVPTSYPSAQKLKDGIIDGTYTIAYQEYGSNRWFYVTDAYSSFSADRDGFWDFKFADTAITTEIKIFFKALVKVTGIPELAFAITGHGPGIYTPGISMNNWTFIRVSV
jgi:hypothetical protein